MSADSGAILESLVEALPADSSPRQDLAALGAITAGVINSVKPEQRHALVERFCLLLRESIAGEFN